MIINLSPRFNRAYKKLPKGIKIDFNERIAIFANNPRAPKLRVHKLKGKLQSCTAFYLKDGYRVLFEFVDANTANLLAVGPHDQYNKWN